MTHTITITRDQAISLFKIHAATDPDATRYALGGIQLEITETHITAAATDARRLYVAQIEKTNLPDIPAMYIDRKTAKRLATIQKTAGNVTLSVNGYKTTVSYRYGKREFSATCEQTSRFPRWRDIEWKPKDRTGELVAPASTIIDALETPDHVHISVNGKTSITHGAPAEFGFEHSGEFETDVAPEFIIQFAELTGDKCAVKLQSKGAGLPLRLESGIYRAYVMPMAID